MYHYNPEIINKITQTSTYNAGLGGQGFFYNYALLKELLKVKKPNQIILDISPNVIVDDKAYEKLTTFLPVADKYPAFKEIVKLDPDYNFFIDIFKVYSYNSTLYELVKSKTDKKVSYSFGFIGLAGTIDSLHFTQMVSSIVSIDTMQVLYFKKIINLCKSNGVGISCYISPTYRQFDVEGKISKIFAGIAQEEGVEFYNYSDHPDFYKKGYLFKDQLHLNYLGANKYSGLIAGKIKTNPTK